MFRKIRFVACLLAAVVLSLGVSCCSSIPTGSRNGVVVLDIGHFVGSGGASTPGAINGKVISECAFWYEYSYYVKRVIERAGYKCVVCNRGNAPTAEPLRSFARRARVVHLRRPDQNAARYPSRYHPDRVASGMVSADYAIYRRASAVVFLHHNSAGGWTNSPLPSLVLSNRYNGRPLASAIAQTLNREVVNRGMDNGGRPCTVQVRYVDADRAAGWLNACDDSGIPAAVIEAAYLNNRKHAAYLVNPTNARYYAESIGRGVVAYLRRGRHVGHVRADENRADEGSFGYAAESRRLHVPGAKLLVR